MKSCSCRNPAQLRLACALLLAAGLYALLPAPAARHSASVRSPASPTSTSATASGPGPSPIAVASVLPELASPVADWRDFAPETITVEPVPGLSLAFKAVSIERDPGATVWTGRADTAGSLLVAVGTSSGWDATLTLPGTGEYDLHVRTGGAVIVAKTPHLDACGHDGRPTVQADRHAAGSLPPAALAEALESSGGPAAAIVDVLFFYDADTLAAAAARTPDGNGAALVDSLLRARIKLCNAVLANSGVTNLQWRFVGSARIPSYARTGRLIDDLAATSAPDTAAGRFMAETAAAVGADQTVLVVGGASDWAGLAHLPGHQSVVSWDAGYETTAHELAHNFGCQHDRRTDNAPEHNGQFAHGFRFAYAGRDCGDIMTYAGIRLPLFSNPALTVNPGAHVLGLPEGAVVFGVEAGQPGAADGARQLRERAAAMAGHRATLLFDAPTIVATTRDLVAPSGGPVTLRVSAEGGALSYQWRKNGAVVPGATGASLSLTAAAPDDAGTYDCIVANALGAVTSRATVVAVDSAPASAAPATPSTGRLVNLSARASVGTGSGVLVGGLTLAGGRAQILVRAVGPGLRAFGVDGTLRDPLLEGFDSSGASIGRNDNWCASDNSAGLAATAARHGAFALPAGSADAALLLTLDPGCYTFHVAGADGGTGVALLEVYLVDNPSLPGRLANLSARACVGSDNDPLIAGFVTKGDARVLVRGVGPTLADYGVADAIARPQLAVFDGPVLVDRATDWRVAFGAGEAAALFRQAGAFPLTEDSCDAATKMDLVGGGVRTVQVSGSDHTPGVVLAELYLVQ